MAMPQDFTAAFPKKYLSAGALFFDDAGRLLIVKPTYKDGWEIPGGIVEQDESPFDACRREVREEIGLEMTPGRLLAVDYRSAEAGRSDSLQLVFLGGCAPEAVATEVGITVNAVYIAKSHVLRRLREEAAGLVL